MSRDEMIYRLEEYWYQQQAKHPEELMDIPTAISWYRTFTMEALQAEYKATIGCL